VYARPGNVYNVSDGKGPEPRIVIGNSGRTFAKEVIRYAAVRLLPPLSPAGEAGLAIGEREPGTVVVSPQVDHAIIRRHRALAPEETSEIKNENGRMRLYVFGRIDYDDVFGQHRHTDFCYIYFGEQDNFPNNGGPGYNSTQARY
jgi:hypothetical protein